MRKRLHALGRRLHSHLGGRLTEAETLHLTLVFVGEVDDALLAPMQDAAARVSVPAFEMAFDRL
ncbi:MAG TPA: 2'-5' RNA ligase family protein, partial [Thiobacillaceae bacterium]|nr:2'-5' RNA ligase family protein [Thiobacillaceae bacterium]